MEILAPNVETLSCRTNDSSELTDYCKAIGLCAMNSLSSAHHNIAPGERRAPKHLPCQNPQASSLANLLSRLRLPCSL